MSDLSHLMTAAMEYRSRGWSIIPVVGKEPPRGCRWKPYQSRLADQNELESWFGNGNHYTGLAVIMGMASAGLFCRDFDDPTAFDRWRDQNPDLASILPIVRSNRGGHVYGRAMPGSLEAVRALLGSKGHGDIDLGDGELRADRGCITVLPPSRHPKGSIYEWVVPLPAELPLVDLQRFVRANGIIEKPGSTHRSTQSNTRHVLCPPESAVSSEVSGSSKYPVSSEGTVCQLGAHPTTNNVLGASEFSVCQQDIDHAIRATLPKQASNRHRFIFEFVRRLKSLPRSAKVNPSVFKPYVRQWHTAALPFIGTKPFEDTWLDFVEGWNKVKFPAGEEPITRLYHQAIASELPAIAQQFEQTELHRLVALCRALQEVSGDQPFYLAGRVAAELLEVPHTQAARWLRLLVFEKVLELVSTGKRHQASEYRYIAT